MILIAFSVTNRDILYPIITLLPQIEKTQFMPQKSSTQFSCHFSSDFTHSFAPDILREYDIRGTIGKNLSAADGRELGRRFGTWVVQNYSEQNPPLVAVGRDGRLSSPELFLNLTYGLREAGVNVLDIGIGPTPMLYFATKTTPVVAGIMITGSHNPKDDNGFKITLKDDPFFGDQIKGLAHQSFIPAETIGTLESIEIFKSYVERLLTDYSTLQPNQNRLKIAWDAGNGAGGDVVELLTQHINADHILLNTTIDGTFPNHHPDPSVEENLIQLRQAIQDHECDVGIAFDGDADRIGILDGQGRIFWGDQLLMVLAQALLAEKPDSIIIADVKSSQGLFDLVNQLGGTAHMGRTGHSLIKKMMKETSAHLSGEMSGHVFYADKYYGYDDGLYAAIRLINILQASHKTAAQIYDDLPKFHATPELRIDCPDDQKFQIIDIMKNDLKKQGEVFSDIDGIRLTNTQGWWLIRASNTQPIIVARCESKTPKGLAILTKHLKQVLSKHSLNFH